MATYPLPFARYRRFFTEGVTLAVAGMQHSDPVDLLPPLVKHRSRMFWHIAERTVNDPASRFHAPGAVPVVLNQMGTADTATGCILAVAEGRVIRPVPGMVLDSISAKVIGELCTALALPCADEPLDFRYFCRPVGPEDARGIADRTTELLLAGTGFSVAGVRCFAVGTESCNYTWPGPVFGKLLAAWSDLVGVDIAKQFTETGG
jgi:branched-chain amino acid aminotransferase